MATSTHKPAEVFARYEMEREHYKPTDPEVYVVSHIGLKSYDKFMYACFEACCLEADYIGLRKDSIEFCMECQRRRDELDETLCLLCDEYPDKSAEDFQIIPFTEEQMMARIKAKYAKVTKTKHLKAKEP